MHIQHVKGITRVNNNNDVRGNGQVMGKKNYSGILEKQLAMSHSKEDRQPRVEGPSSTQIMRSHKENLGRNYTISTGQVLGDE